jgi:hypothetical protein
MAKERDVGRKPGGTVRRQGFMTFQESAKKFKPGPVAPPEIDGERPDMAGAPPTTATGAIGPQTADEPAQGRMSDGKPGKLQKMPGEEEERKRGA